MSSTASIGEQPGFYDDPLIYDVLHTQGTAEDVKGLIRIATEHGLKKGLKGGWFEPFCGTARHLRAVALHGARVTGLDLSGPMIEFAQGVFDRRGLKGSLLTGDASCAHELAGSESHAFAFCLINSMRHLMHGKAALAHMRSVHRLLKPGGVYAVGVNYGGFEDGVALEHASEDVWKGGRGRLSVTQVVQYEPPVEPSSRVETVRSVLDIRRGDAEPETRVSVYTLRTYTGAQWMDLVSRSGFEHTGSVDEDGEPHDPGRAGYAIHLLCKPR
ncbi:MAG: class I SAM-dependent methyltransferase [Planctomycetota bacterium]